MNEIAPYPSINRFAFPCSCSSGTMDCEIYRNHTMKVSGKGSVSAFPDKATAVLGITTENIQLEAAQRENAQKTSAVIDSLLKSGVPRKDIQTQTYQIQPQYDYIEGKQLFRGYQVIHELKVDIDQIAMTGRIIDAAVNAGANSVGGIEFTVKNPSAYYNAALQKALSDAMEKAAVIAGKLNVNVSAVPIRIVEETSHNVTPVPFPSVQSTGAPTPVMPGQIEIEAFVEAIFQYYGHLGFLKM